MIDIDKTIEGNAVLSTIKDCVECELYLKTYSLTGPYLNFKADGHKIEVQLLKHEADESMLSDIADFLEDKNIKKTVYSILKKIQPICGKIIVDGTYIEMKEENKNNTDLSIERLKQMGYQHPCTVRWIIESVEKGKDPDKTWSGLINGNLISKINGHLLHVFDISYTHWDWDELYGYMPSRTENKDLVFLIDRKWVPSKNGDLLGKVVEAIRDGKTVEEALECLKEEKAEKTRECNKIDDFFIRRLGNSLFFDVTTKGGFLTIKVDERRFRKVLPSGGCNYYDFAKPFIGKDYGAFLTVIREAVLEISENGQGLYAKKEAPAPESNEAEGEQIRISTEGSSDEIEVNTTAACDDTAKAKDSDKEEVTEKRPNNWWTQPINDIEFTRIEFDKAKAKQAAKSEAPCDLQCAVSFCKDIFEEKCGIYGLSFSEMNLETLTDQLFMKATILKRRLTDRNKSMRLGFAFFEGIRDEFAAVVNYGVIALRQGGLGVQSLVPEAPLKFYTDQMQAALSLISEKGDDYGELWREQRIGTLADMIYTKVRRLKGIEDQYRFGSMTKEDYHKFAGDQYRDLINYGLFGVVRMTEIADVLAFELEEGENEESGEYEWYDSTK